VGAKLRFLAIRPLVILAICGCSRSPMERLVVAARTLRSRPAEGRLCGFEYAPRPHTDQGNPSGSEISLNIEAVAADILANARGNDSPTCRARAASHLFFGRPEAAAKELETFVKQHHDDARAWSDLAAARYEAARKNEDFHGFVIALTAADTAMRQDPLLEEAAFNRAMALAALHLDAMSGLAFRHFRVITKSSQWSQEANERADGLQKSTMRQSWRAEVPSLQRAAQSQNESEITRIVEAYRQDSRTWSEAEFLGLWAIAESAGDVRVAQGQLNLAREIGKTLFRLDGEALLRDAVAAIDRATPQQREDLIRGHRSYRQGRMLYAQRRLADASAPLSRAALLFRSGRSPMAFMAEYYGAHLAMDQSRFVPAETTARSIERGAPSNYRALHAGIHWLQGTLHARAGQLWEALTEFTKAQDEFALLHESDRENFMRTARASTLAYLGQEAAMWQQTADAWKSYSQLGDYRSLQIAVLASADEEISRSRFNTARSLLNVAVELSPLANNPRSDATALVWRALASARSDRSHAVEDMATARHAIDKLADVDLRADSQNDLRVAVAVTGHNFVVSEHLLTEAIDYLAARKQLLRLPYLYLERGKIRRHRSNLAGAITDLAAAARIAEVTRSGITAENVRDTYFADAGDIYTELIDLLQSAGRTAEAFEVAERAHGRTVLDRYGAPTGVAEPLTVEQLRSLIPPAVTIVEYVAVSDRILRFRLDRTGVQCDSFDLSSQALSDLITQLVQRIREDDDAHCRTISGRLYQVLIGQLNRGIAPSGRLVIVADTVLSRLPFPALFDETTQQYLIEQTPIVLAPSASTFARITPTHRGNSAPSVLIVSDPTNGEPVFSDLPRLPAAGQEARQIRSIFADSRVLSGTSATVSALLAQLPSQNIVDLATHAIIDDRDPSETCLVLAPDGRRTGALYLREIAALKLKNVRLVTLAGCRTAAASQSAVGEVRSLAAAFTLAGARSVIGSLWDADDQATCEFSVRVHTNIVRGASAAAAVQQAQVAMIHSADPRVRALASWANMQLYGIGN